VFPFHPPPSEKLLPGHFVKTFFIFTVDYQKTPRRRFAAKNNQTTLKPSLPLGLRFCAFTPATTIPVGEGGAKGSKGWEEPALDLRSELALHRLFRLCDVAAFGGDGLVPRGRPHPSSFRPLAAALPTSAPADVAP